MSRARKVISELGMKSFYYGHVFFHLKYNILAWGGAKTMHEVMKSQKRVLRSMFGLKKTASCKEHFRKHRFLTVVSIYILELLKLVRENDDIFVTFKNAHSYGTRGGSDVQLSSVKSARFCSTLCLLAASLYNKLPKSIKEIEDIRAFLNNAKNLLITKACYMIDEF